MAEETVVKQKQIHGVEAPIDDTVAGGVEDRRQVSSSIPDGDDGSPLSQQGHVHTASREEASGAVWEASKQVVTVGGRV